MSQQSKTKLIASLFAPVAVLLLLWRVAPALNGLWSELSTEPTPVAARPPRIERLDLDDPAYQDTEVRREHLAQYQFARDYSEKHGFQSVADIASGTCYGMKMIQEVVPTVDGYDKEDLCGNYVLDLDKEDWNRKYDAIVSFETIEHLARPEFFLENAVRSAPVLLLSAPVNEGPGNEFHLQHWSLEELQELLERYYTCEYLHRVGDKYEPGHIGGTDLFAVCRRKTQAADAAASAGSE